MPFDATLNLIALMLSGAMAALLAGVLRWVASPTPESHYRHWAASWFAQAAYYLIGGAAFALGVLSPRGASIRLTLSAATQVASTLAAIFLVSGALGFANRRAVERRALYRMLAGGAVLGVVIALAVHVGEVRVLRPIYRAAISSASLIACGVIIWRGRETLDRAGQFLSLAVLGFGAMQLHYLAYWILSAAGYPPRYGLGWLTLFDLFWITAIATTMVAMGVADQREAGALALRRQQADFQRMIEQSNDIVTLLDQDLVIRYLSPSAARLVGWGDELLGEPIVNWIHPDDRPAIARRVAMIDAGISPPPTQTRIRTRDGNWVRFEAVTTRTVDECGNRRIIVNARDISDRERLEASLRESQKMESIGRLAGGVAHDLNNILTVIGSNVHMSLDGTSGARREALDEVLHATARAADLTRQLLAFARRQVVAPRVFPVADSVERTARMAARLLPASIEFRTRPATADYHVEADPGQIEQVVMNLIVNARDAILDRGRIDVEVGEVDVSGDQRSDVAPGRYATVTVRDTGAGIPEAIRAQIFEPFFTTKAAGEGTGLGLSTSYGIVRQAGGFIAVESAEGAGSTFTVHLPAVPPPAEGPADAVPAVPTGHGELVLVAEDDAQVRALTVQVLERSGFRAIAAANGSEALQLAESSPPIRVLVSDVVMPRLGGVELARRLRAARPEVGVLLLSGYPGEGAFLSTLPPRAEFLQKPVSPPELLRRVAALAATGVGEEGGGVPR